MLSVYKAVAWHVVQYRKLDFHSKVESTLPHVQESGTHQLAVG